MEHQIEKARRFEQLHQQEGAFIIANPWDMGSAKLLSRFGFKALATTGAGYAFSRGLPDNRVGRAQMMQHLAEIASATSLPVSADLENGFSAAPEEVAETIRLAAATGVVGGSIEDSTGDAQCPLYPLPSPVERIRAAVAAARALPFRFMLTARTENLLLGPADLKETITRLQAYQDAGADVLFAPGLSQRHDIATVVRAVDRPVNVMTGIDGFQLDIADLAGLGVRRISLGGSLARTALGSLIDAAREMQHSGTFCYAQKAVSSREINALFALP